MIKLCGPGTDDRPFWISWRAIAGVFQSWSDLPTCFVLVYGEKGTRYVTMAPEELLERIELERRRDLGER